ncbi:MAG: hypothetical protein ABI164_08315 [Acidobacteriaceae bacterium]
MQIMNAAAQLAQTKHAGNGASPQLRQAADQFEASFLQELLKPLTEDSMFQSSSGGSMGTVSSIASQALADGIARAGGLGIAKRVLADLAPVEAAQSSNSEAAGSTRCGGCAVQLPSLGAAPGTDGGMEAAGLSSVSAGDPGASNIMQNSGKMVHSWQEMN